MTRSDTKPLVPDHGPLWARAVVAIKNIVAIALVLFIVVGFGVSAVVIAGVFVGIILVVLTGEGARIPFVYRGAIGVVGLLTPVVFALLAVRAGNVVADARDCNGGEGR